MIILVCFTSLKHTHNPGYHLMLYIPGCAAAICHSVVLLVGGFFSSNAYQAMGFNDKDPVRNNTDINSLVAIVAFQFFPTFTVMCFGFSWLCCAYRSEVGAYALVIAPVAYGVLWLIWVFSEIGKYSCLSASSQGDAMRGLTKRDRAMFKNQQRDLVKRQRMLQGGVFGSDEDYYEGRGASPAQRLADIDGDNEGNAHSPYLQAKKEQEAREALYQLELREGADRQKRFNREFEIYQSRLNNGEAVGPFIFEGQLIPTDKKERKKLEAIRDAGAIAVY